MSDHPKHSLAEFLTRVPPNNFSELTDAYEDTTSINVIFFRYPVITLFCDTSYCGGDRSHDPSVQGFRASESGGSEFVNYTCRHCSARNKTFALVVWKNKGAKTAAVMKVGEHPHFGPHTPAKVLRIFGDGKVFYLKGRRAESLGLGIAAFAYYRRVVEDHKNELLAEILRVAKHLDARPDQIASIEASLKEISFEKSLAAVKGAIPESLLLRGGENPMALLHTALSAGLHNDNDEECLELAHAIRVVLAEFAERVQTVMAENQELKNAVTKLLQRKSKTVTPKIDLPNPSANVPAEGQK